MIEKEILNSRALIERHIINIQNQKSNNLKTELTGNTIKKISLENEEAVPDVQIKSLFGDTSLHKFKSHNLILFFYPKDNTPGCTIECEDFSKLHSKFLKLDTQIIGVSRDSISSHNKFANKYNLSINLISDSSGELCSIFDVIKQKKMYGKVVKGIERSTFFINSKGKLKKSWRGVSAKGHAENILKEIQLIYNLV
tara:strand:+ start:445 stop:1035 length:591 start_codon:yes stop_codon:yes gene_type:complete